MLPGTSTPEVIRWSKSMKVPSVRRKGEICSVKLKTFVVNVRNTLEIWTEASSRNLLLRLIKALDAKKHDSPHQHWSWLLQLWSSWSKKFELAEMLWAVRFPMRCFDCLASQDRCVLLPRSLREADLKIAKLTRVLMETLYKNLVTNPGSWNSAAGRLRGDRAAYHSTSN